MKKILVVDDEKVIRTLCQRVISRMGHEVVLAESVKDASAKISAGDHFDMLVVDMNLPDGEGVDIIAIFRKKFIYNRIVVITGSSYPEDHLEKIKEQGLGPVDVLPKPFELQDLVKMVSRGVGG